MMEGFTEKIVNTAIHQTLKLMETCDYMNGDPHTLENAYMDLEILTSIIAAPNARTIVKTLANKLRRRAALAIYKRKKYIDYPIIIKPLTFDFRIKVHD